MGLEVYEWGDADAPAIVCLHGVQGHGRRFRRLAGERLVPAGFRVLAADLRGHGRSTSDPPWSMTTHVADAVELGERIGPAAWLGHSFGGRLVLELAAARPDLVLRAILLDPAIQVPAADALEVAEELRRDQSWADRAELIAARQEAAPHAPLPFLEEEVDEHAETGPDGRLRLRYLPAAVVTMYGDLVGAPPAPPSCPTLLVAGADADFVQPQQVERLQAALGGRLTTATVPGGHIVLWDAYEATATAIERFLEERPG